MNTLPDDWREIQLTYTLHLTNKHPHITSFPACGIPKYTEHTEAQMHKHFQAGLHK